ncbi:bifunctional glutamate N-acetyltransferase/amino-acid acetyltransferase ArgJ [Thiohalomonas denitrificans]|uniref:Arginine biosynthesis bifunctional protein ArgJ n=1 Tax=Thiohalomonas denitrificans TaxID=415747 RepID=A0A1G5PLN2_9GAMM|nr:bifunctional glutamate N-acetyltransferase/amino-acid acetyltransferase ArgJ [Thiohalomonas denitrificans]SCZ50382.1 glutamate N-acetyltransferase [Thiohalomonas denitrificans]
MAVGYQGLPKLHPVGGVRLGTTAAGIKKPGRPDLVLIELARGATASAVFTRNAFCAAPVILAREHLSAREPSYLLVNTGNANAGTGRQGLVDAQTCCEAVASRGGCEAADVLPFSTGVIGEPLPVATLTQGIPAAFSALVAEGWANAADGILTTDTVPKGSSRQVEIGGRPVTITGISKGAGMIRPDMATMLAFIATDAVVERDVLDGLLKRAAGLSFNRISVDGDTSTNDACVLMATGASGVKPEPGSDDFETLETAVTAVCRELAQLIVRDGEGATKFIAIKVVKGRDQKECTDVAYTIAHSPLVKTAFFASDPNWGRILAAVGRAGVPDLNLQAVTIHLNEVCIVSDGGRAADYEEARGQLVMDQEEITIRVDLSRGSAEATVWTCDFSYDYVRINAEYRT